MGAVDRGTTVAAGAGTAAVRALIRALGPAGRALVRLVTPVWRLLCRGWEGIGRRVFLAMARPLGRFGRWLLARSRPAIARVLSAARQAARLVAPGVRRLEEALAVVERRAARWGALIDRAWAPVQRFARTVRSGRGR
jgi:hypothetical protein